MITREIGGKPRRTCPECRYIHFVEAKVGVGICVIEDGRILLVKRKFSPEKGKWSIPAGFLDKGDAPKAHAIREVFEETGLEVSVLGLIDVFYNAPQEDGAGVFVLYRGQIEGGQLEAGDDASDAHFFAPGELPELAFASTRHAIEILGEGQV